MFASSAAALVLALAPVALAGVYPTAPIASTTWPAGQPATVTWQDDGQAPALSSFGLSSISIYAGNLNQQSFLQSVGTNVDVSQISSATFTPDPSIGPNGAFYFVRFQSNSLMDATNPQYPALAFSSKFTLSGMTGTFNATVQSEVDGASTAPIGGATAPAAPGPSSPAAGASTPAATTHASTPSAAAPSKSGSSGAAKPTTTTSGAGRVAAAVGVVFAGLAVALFGTAL